MRFLYGNVGTVRSFQNSHPAEPGDRKTRRTRCHQYRTDETVPDGVSILVSHFPDIMGPSDDRMAWMRLTRRTSNLLLSIGIFMLFVWSTRFYTFISIDLQQSTGYLPWIHFPLVAVSLAIGFYLTYLGVKGRRASQHDP